MQKQKEARAEAERIELSDNDDDDEAAASVVHPACRPSNQAEVRVKAERLSV